MQKEDLRVRRTKKLLADALKELMSEKPFEKIKVVDICEKALVHRATFYAHFEDKYQLLRYCMQDYESSFDKPDMTAHTPDGYKNYYLNIARDIFTGLANDKTLTKSLLKKNKDDSIITNVRYGIIEKINDKLKNCENAGIEFPIPKEVIAYFFGGGCISRAEWWIENDMPIPVSELIEFLQKLIPQDFFTNNEN